MKIPFVDLRRQYLTVNEQVLTAISEALNSMRLFLGPNVQAFEEEFSRYCGTEFAIGVGSGTEALHLALLACGASNSDEVITVSNTFFATVEAIALTGSRPVFVDIDQQTYNMDPFQIESKITSRTKVILPVHLYGHPADMDSIMEVARNRNLKVVEDACQAHGAEYKGRRTGSLGDVGCFSFYFTKNLGAYGEAGMIVTSDPDIARKCKMLRDHGQDIKHNHALMGVNGRLDEIQASVLRVKLPHLDEWNEKRRTLAKEYSAGLPSSVVKPGEMPWARHVYHLYVIRTTHRDALRSWLEDNGVGTGIHYPTPIHLQEACRDNGCSEYLLPVTETVTKEILSLPMYPELSVEEVAYICDLVSVFQETCSKRSTTAVKKGSQSYSLETRG
jgi:dTDP-4-amino-4,6-dideoxygalactose transaminase